MMAYYSIPPLSVKKANADALGAASNSHFGNFHMKKA
jgi:hypothetical protein